MGEMTDDKEDMHVFACLLFDKELLILVIASNF